jgi:hypothetical protein
LPSLPKIKARTTISKPRPVDLGRRPPVQVPLGCQSYGFAMPHPDPVDPNTMVAGVRKRFAFSPPSPDPLLLTKLKAFCLRWCKRNLVPIAPDRDMSVEAWLESTRYPSSRKKELLDKWNRVGHITQDNHKFYKCKSFMKDETYVEYKHARGINSRSDEFKCFSGPYFKAIEEELYKHPAFIKHVPVADRPRYIKDMLESVGGVYLATDYTAFEALFTRELMLHCEFVMYEYMLKHQGPEVMETLTEALTGRNTCEFKNFTVQLDATRMSGEMCTSLGNGFSNLMFMLFMCEQLGSSVKGCVEGDDGIFSVVGPVPTAADFARLGLVIKLDVHHVLSEASFCGIIYDDAACDTVCDPREVMASFGWTTNRYLHANSRTKLDLLRCKSLSYIHQYPACPIIAELARFGLRMTRGRDVSTFAAQRWQVNMWEREQLLSVLDKPIFQKEISDNTRLLVERKYGIPIELQLEWESMLRSMNSIQELDFELFDLTMPQAWLHYWDNYCLSTDNADDMPLWPVISGFKVEWSQ